MFLFYDDQSAKKVPKLSDCFTFFEMKTGQVFSGDLPCFFVKSTVYGTSRIRMLPTGWLSLISITSLAVAAAGDETSLSLRV